MHTTHKTPLKALFKAIFHTLLRLIKPTIEALKPLRKITLFNCYMRCRISLLNGIYNPYFLD
jgi:hypothetical protein